MTRLLGLDVGSVRIGVALADTESGTVRPLATLRRGTPERDGASVRQLVEEHRIDEVVVGLPLSLDGSAGPQAKATREWAAAALGAMRQAICWRDERLTTERAQARLGRGTRGAAGGPPSRSARRSRSARLDRESAALILQAELDARAGAAQ